MRTRSVAFRESLGVSDHVTKHSKSIIEKAAKENWGMCAGAGAAQADVESELLALRDEEIAHLVSLGGWLRGVEIVSTLLAEDFTAERAARLVQPEAADYFIERLGTLNPNLKSRVLFSNIEEALKAIRATTVKPEKGPLTLEDVKKSVTSRRTSVAIADPVRPGIAPRACCRRMALPAA